MRTIIHELVKVSYAKTLKENLAIDFPDVFTSLDCNEGDICNFRMQYNENQLLEDRLHYYLIGYTAHRLNGEK